MHNRLIHVIPKCEKCEIPFKLIKSRDSLYDSRCYSCPICNATQSLRFESFLSEFKLTMMEIVRIIFYYFARGFTVDTVWKELSSFVFLDGGRL